MGSLLTARMAGLQTILEEYMKIDSLLKILYEFGIFNAPNIRRIRAMTNLERVHKCLDSIYPRRATNADIVNATLIKPHQQVFQITSKLRKAGSIKGIQGLGGEWEFWVDK